MLWVGLHLMLIGAANIAPILAKRRLGGRWSAPLDGGPRFVDGQPLLGPSKMVRGVVAAVFVTTAGAVLMGTPLVAGALISNFGRYDTSQRSPNTASSLVVDGIRRDEKYDVEAARPEPFFDS